jgi:hypothetical protein
MNVPQTVADVLKNHVVFELECIDRMYLNFCVLRLQREKEVAAFFRFHRGHRFASSALMEPMSKGFVRQMEQHAREHQIPVVPFDRAPYKGRKKDLIAQEFIARQGDKEGVMFLGKAQEKTRVCRTERRRSPDGQSTYPWIVKSSAMVNQYYWYILDADFGPFFLKFGSYFPYNAKVCLNGHEWLKRQLAMERIPYEALDNGLLRCGDPKRAQALAASLGPAKIEALLRKWLGRLPHPFTAADRRAGYRYEPFIWQAEFSLTQVLDRPLSGRVFFEEVIRENLDLGRPDQVALIFARRITRRARGWFRTRVITEGVMPSLHLDYWLNRIKQYFKNGRGLRTETTINNSAAFKVPKRLQSLPQWRQIGFQANRRLLDVQKISQDCALGEAAFAKINQPIQVEDQRVSGLRYGDARVQALLTALLLFVFVANGFAAKDLRPQLAALLGLSPDKLTAGRLSYDLRRLRLHGLIERIAHTHRYRLTQRGIQIAAFWTRTYNRLLRPGLAQLEDPHCDSPPLRRKLLQLTAAIDQAVAQAKIAA